MTHLILLIIFGIWTFLYLDVFSTLPVMDDLNHIASIKKYGWYRVMNPFPIQYRPIESMLLSVSFLLFGDHKFALLMNLSLFALSASLFYKVVERLFASRRVSVIASILYIFHSIQTSSLIQLDTLSQTMVNLFTFTNLLLFYKLKNATSIKNYFYIIAGIIGLLLSKGTALGLALALPFLALLPQEGKNLKPIDLSFWKLNFIRQRTPFVASMVIVVVLIAGYLFVKIFVFEQVTHSLPLKFHPVHVFKNLILAIGSSIYLGNSSLYFLEPDFNFEIILSALLSLFCLLLLITYLIVRIKAKDLKLFHICYIIFLMLAANFPTAFLGRVSELYSYQLYPYYCILLALGLEHFSFRENSEKKQRSFLVSNKNVLIGLILIFIIISGRAIHYKIHAYIREGQYGKVLLQAQLNQVPLDEFKKLCRTQEKKFYSIYYMTNQNINHYIQINFQTIYGVPYLRKYDC